MARIIKKSTLYNIKLLLSASHRQRHTPQEKWRTCVVPLSSAGCQWWGRQRRWWRQFQHRQPRGFGYTGWRSWLSRKWWTQRGCRTLHPYRQWSLFWSKGKIKIRFYCKDAKSDLKGKYCEEDDEAEGDARSYDDGVSCVNQAHLAKWWGQKLEKKLQPYRAQRQALA